ncbi:phenylalanyl-tRNA synthetase beta subunit [Volucribacter psittacicida]|uniref:Phenylalanine--tRNA ligase beta subunit n=1 Tax=Volucribacter psittacicida TaxID=203482 RepID=A0A4R1G0L8_9PAST|nr:phenylalanine--tRNA ligase subunit beta [Volucribacter psittacicida]TCK01587.1 phenylalanyl-tRNA synthetase beta subunit [Volucribacter psittacicida]
MKFSELWVREWVNPAMTTEQLCEQITMLGLEVDDVANVAGEFTGVVVGEVVACEKHPDADKLRVTKVNVGSERLLDIVCGAPNCRQGLKVACAVDGAVLPGNFKIKKTKLRGQPSEGMLCSYSELGITEDHDGIIELPVDAPIGTDLRQYLQLDDKSIEISLTPNRADCLSISGIARELGVANKLSLNPPHFNACEQSSSEKVQIEVQAPEACPRYLLRAIQGVNVKAHSPVWLKEKLRRCGIRSIDPIVDVTNYVLLELGQPMHAFDAAKVAQPVQVRLAKEGELLTLLDGNQVSLQPNTLIIADQKGPLAMAGIFGGKESGVNSETQDILLESAFFAPLAITGRARQYGLHTDSSHRFERGVDFTLQHQAMERATALIIEICGGQAGEICEVVNQQYLPTSHQVSLRRSQLDKVLGHHIATETVTDIFERLGFKPSYADESWTITSPSWRFDIAIEEDLIEEVARIYGYNNIPNQAPLAHLTMGQHRESDVDIEQIKTALVANDFHEAITYSFVNPKVQRLLHPEQPAWILPNPISSEMSAMRVSLLTGLLEAVLYNQNRQQNRVRLFETGLRFIPDSQAEFGIRQELVFSAIMTGARLNEHWTGKSENSDFFDLKGYLENILALTSVANKVKFVAKTYPAFHPGQSAAIMLEGQEIGFIGQIHPSITQKLGLNGKVFACEVIVRAIAHRDVANAKEISRFPSNRRDLAVVVQQDIAASDVLEVCREVAGEKLAQINLFDVYQGTGVAEGHKSLAISLIIQDSEKTLGDEEINAVISQVVTELKQRFNAYLRD